MVAETVPSPLPALPTRLSERVHRLNDADVDPAGRYVLCWLHHAVRDHDNPALDVAVTIGNALDRPVLVYQGLGGRHRFNSDRHHTFILEGARELADGLARRGIAYACSVPANPAAPSPLRGLVEGAAAVVTEDFPAPPFPKWTARLAERAPCAALAVDAACLMPLRLLGSRFTRAYAFREAAEAEWRTRIAQPWPDVEPAVPPLDLVAVRLGFTPVDFDAVDIPDLCAACAIDHGIPPVARTPGGMAAGAARWAAFRDRHLARYDKRRNDAADMDAVSGLSPYLHHGHVSPFRVAREAHERGGPGAEKFLDELLVWRELAYNFCGQTSEATLESLLTLPSWAQETLKAHVGDERPMDASWETLGRGRTGDDLWDAAQRSLLLNGELHNNLRMTWGKMIPAWTRTPDEALRLLIDLNHRYALDGSDPCSYGGLLWCLGQFDRPFSPEQPVLGRIRSRSTATHGGRLEVDRYARAVESRHGYAPLRVGVVGAGIAGLACARTLRDHGCAVTVLDRGRAPGGRMSTRRDDDGAFDHGAPFFEARDERFVRFVRSWIHDGLCAPWRPERGAWDDGRLVPVHSRTSLFVGTPGMNALAGHLAADLDVRCSSPVVALTDDDDGWHLAIESTDEARPPREGPFDVVVLAMPGPQAVRVLPPKSPLIAPLAEVTMHPVWVAVLDADQDMDEVPPLIELPDHPVLAMLVRDDAKPGRARRPGRARWIVHAGFDWSAARYGADRREVAEHLADETGRLFASLIGTGDALSLRARVAHRWGLARPTTTRPEACLVDRATGLIACGDTFRDGVEGAFLSGMAAAGRILAARPPARSAPRPSLLEVDRT